MIPLIADADTDYGNAINAILSVVQAFERLGVAAIQFEDQITPNRGGHWSGKQVVPKEEMVMKLRAAVEIREDPDLVLVARVEAIAVEGFERAMERLEDDTGDLPIMMEKDGIVLLLQEARLGVTVAQEKLKTYTGELTLQ